MRIKNLAAAVAVGLIGGAVALAAPASAHHNAPEVALSEIGDCGEVTITTAWSEDTHAVDNAALVVLLDGEVSSAPIGESITVGPFESEAVIQYRVWGGGERDYDEPALEDLDAIVDHIDDGGSPLDADAPGVAWHEIVVGGCPPQDPEPDPEPDPTATPSPGLECVNVNTAGAEELLLLRHVDEERAAQMIELRPFSSVADLDRVDGLAADGPRLAELVEGGEGFLPLCEITADDDGEGGGLPVTGANPGLIAGGAVILLAAGGALYLLARRRGVSFTPEG